MATITLTSPGVEITETDASRVARPIGGTNVLLTGFSQTGTTNEFTTVSDFTDFTNNFFLNSKPQTAAEEYLYYTAKEILNTSPANLTVVRLPYGSTAGIGYSDVHSALVYPVYDNVPNSTSYVYGISSLSILDGGSGYVTPPVVQIVGGGKDGANATRPPTFVSVLGDPNNGTFAGTVTALTLTTGSGAGFYTTPTINFVGGGATRVASASANFQIKDVFYSQQIVGLSSIMLAGSATSVYNGISGFGYGYKTAPNVNVSFSGDIANVAPANQATANAILADPKNKVLVGTVTAINVTKGGEGYSYPPTITFSGGSAIPGTTIIPPPSATASIGILGNVANDYSNSDNYVIGEPTLIPLTNDQYNKVVTGQTNWLSAYPVNNFSVNGFDDIGKGGIVVLNTTKVAIDSQNEGYYIAMIDNTQVNPALDYTSINGIKSININPTDQNPSFTGNDYIDIPTSRLEFNLTGSATGNGAPSLSETLENLKTGVKFSDPNYKDSLIFVLLKITSSQYNEDTIKLSYKIVESYSGSLYSNRTVLNPNGGNSVSYFLENVVNNESKNLKVFVNPYLSNNKSKWIDTRGKVLKSVTIQNNAKKLYPNGLYADNTLSTLDLGNIPLKISNVINQIQNSDQLNFDVVVEAGLGTIWAGANAQSNPSVAAYSYDDSKYIDIGAFGNQYADGTYLYSVTGSDNYTGYGVQGAYRDVVDQFIDLANSVKNHVLIIDPLRQIFVQGDTNQIAKNPTFVYSQQLLTPLKNLFKGINSSYVTTYANWIQATDLFNVNGKLWLPPSGFVAANIASASQSGYPWDAVAGLNRGILSATVKNIAINPTQKQRDYLYAQWLNPIAYFPNDNAYAIFGQHMFYDDTSAFSRLNVRRLFLTLEKQTKDIMKYFVFEPNSFSTRQRVVNTLSPILDNAKVNNGIYDYIIVCDTRNNTPDTIDNNQLIVDIYIQPVRTAEYILCNFIAETTGTVLSQIVGG